MFICGLQYLRHSERFDWLAPYSDLVDVIEQCDPLDRQARQFLNDIANSNRAATCLEVEALQRYYKDKYAPSLISEVNNPIVNSSSQFR